MNWTHVTTVAWADEDRIMCEAHEHGARAVIAAPNINLKNLTDKESRKEWIRDALDQVQSQFRDGISFDYETPQLERSIEGQTYALLVAETRDTFHEANPSLQVSTCVPWSPDDIDGRAYPFGELAEASDILYVMDYDTLSQIFGTCIAGSNAPFPGMVHGMQRWFDLGISPEKFVLGVPWYGYQYPCLDGTAPDAVYCPIESVPFRGVNCSDAAGKQVAYLDILTALGETNTTRTGGLRRDSNTGSPFFNVVMGDGTVVQYWFDDSTSLMAKYAWARQHGLAGVGPFVFRNLATSVLIDNAVSMWSALDAFASWGADLESTVI